MGLQPFEVRIFVDNFGQKFTKFDLELQEDIRNRYKFF